MSDTANAIEAIAIEADRTADEPMPDVEPTRPNKSVVVAVRLAPEDVTSIEALSARTGTPVSALLRTWITTGLASTKAESVSAAIARLSADVELLRHLVA